MTFMGEMQALIRTMDGPLRVMNCYHSLLLILLNMLSYQSQNLMNFKFCISRPLHIHIISSILKIIEVSDTEC